MRISLVGAPLVVLAALIASPPALQAQGLEDAKAKLPSFTPTAEGYRAELYMYYPSADLMMKLEASAAAGLFSDFELGYLVGSLEVIASQFLANAWYGDYDEATIASAAQQLYSEAKTMKQAFQPAKATFGVAMDAAGLTVNFAGVAADGVTMVSTSVKLTWAEVLAG